MAIRSLANAAALVDALVQVRRLTGCAVEEAFVDRGYRGHSEKTTTVYISGQKRGIKTQRLRRSLKRRQAIEPVIGHLKSDGLLGRNYLKGTAGDHMNVMLSCAGHNLRLILRQLRIFYRRLFGGATPLTGLEHFVGRCKTLLTNNASWRYPRATSNRLRVYPLHVS